MKAWRRLTWGEIAAVVTAVVVAAGYFARGGEMFSPGPLNARTRSASGLGGVQSHAQIGGDCAACHVPAWSKESMASRCLACHASIRGELDSHGPMHGLLAEAAQCRTCHTEHQGPHAALTSFAQFDHDCTAFKLTGMHASVECQSCHLNKVYKGTAQTCVSCHAEPQVHVGKFGTGCSSCHSTADWKATALTVAGAAKFDHAQTGFKLTGLHVSTDCKACHKTASFKGLSQTCATCHTEPQVHAGKFGTGCASCHSTAEWKTTTVAAGGPAKFDHAQTGFKLTGAHGSIDCKSCHKTNTFKGLSQTCASCHAEPAAPVVHKFRYGNNCSSCHSTVAWAGATFSHTIFSINHGKRSNTCATCHQELDNFAKYTCYNCHEHTPEREARRHVRRNVVKLDNCIECHGRKGRRNAGLEDGTGPALCSACPQEGGLHAREDYRELIGMFAGYDLRGKLYVLPDRIARVYVDRVKNK